MERGCVEERVFRSKTSRFLVELGANKLVPREPSVTKKYEPARSKRDEEQNLTPIG